MHIYIETLAHTNRLRDLPPAHKLGLAFAVLFIAFISHAPVQLAIIFWMAVWTVGYAGIPAGIYLKMMAGAGVFLLVSLPALAVNIISGSQMHLLQGDEWVGAVLGGWYFYISRTGTHTALGIAARSGACVSCLFFALLTVPFSEILQVLRQMGCPALLTELLLLMYRFIFVLLRTAAELWVARESRNGNRSWRIAWGSLGLLISQLFITTFERYRQVSLTLASRGFTGEFRVWHRRRHYRLSRRYALEAFLGCLVLLSWEFLTVYNLK
jgi:cobalt/nickel transport system permease protein